MLRRLLPILALALVLAGCASKPIRQVPGDGAALAQAQQLGETAIDVLQEQGPLVPKIVLKILASQQAKFDVAIADHFRMVLRESDAIAGQQRAEDALKAERAQAFSYRQRQAAWKLSIGAALIAAALFFFKAEWIGLIWRFVLGRAAGFKTLFARQKLRRQTSAPQKERSQVRFPRQQIPQQPRSAARCRI